MDWAALFFQLIVAPGFLFTALLGMAMSTVDRKVTAWVQMRAGPPLLQPLYDMMKYMVKETCLPSGGSTYLFITAPLLGLASVTLASTIICRSLVYPGQAFVGDLIVVLYLLMIPSLAVVLGAFASRNPLASMGGSREMKLMTAYELPFLLACFVPVIQNHSIKLGELISAAPAVTHVSGVLALLGAVFCMQAKLSAVPFDMPEAETELAGGACIEYSGPLLGIFKLTRHMMLVAMPLLLVALFCGGVHFDRGVLAGTLGILKYVGLVVVFILMRNTAPRVRIDQAMKFFWGPVAALAFAAAALALFGR